MGAEIVQRLRAWAKHGHDLRKSGLGKEFAAWQHTSLHPCLRKSRGRNRPKQTTVCGAKMRINIICRLTVP